MQFSPFLLGILGLGLASCPLFAQQPTDPPPAVNADDPQLLQEIRGLRTLIEQQSKQIQTIEKRLSKLEGQLGRQDLNRTPILVPRIRVEPMIRSDDSDRRVGPSSDLRPVGGYFVDENGVIWDAGGRPVGLWGVNGRNVERDKPKMLKR